MNPLSFIRAMRLSHWSKNAFVFAALVFAWGDRSRLDELGQRIPLPADSVMRTCIVFVAFCLAASAVYLVNDAIDAESDRVHPDKKNRPVASGEISRGAAFGFGLLLAIGALSLAASVPGGRLTCVVIIALYLAINLAYSLRLKKVVLVDAFCIASGFLLRVEAGGEAAQAEVSRWLVLCTLFVALFLALNKRRAEIDLLEGAGATHRLALKEYTIGFLDQMVGVLAACTIVCYTMYTVDAETASKFGEDNVLIWSVPFAAFGVGRYMVLVQSRKGGADPVRVLLGGDPWILLNTLAWMAVVVFAVSG